MYSEERGGEEREMEEDRDTPRIDPGVAPIFKEKVGFLFLTGFVGFGFQRP